MEEKGKVCVTGGTGYVASWLIMRLLQHGYSVNTTIRSPTAGSRKDISFLTNLPKASEKLHVFNADMDDPDSFGPAIEGCVGVFHVAHPVDFQNIETEETITDRSVRATLGILRACLDSKTVKRVLYTSSASTVTLNDHKGGSRDDVLLDEATWSDLDYVRSSNMFGASYCISKTVTERVALEFGARHCLDVVSVVPSWIHGPFICPGLPGSVRSSLAVFMDDVASAHIFLFEYPEAKGRYICSAVEITIDELSELVSKKFPEYNLSRPESLVDRSARIMSLSSKKLLDAGFKYKYGAEEMFNDAIDCCKQKGFL
ncbi:vestitone reductase [Phtheirospermum japonicum]|uniref:Dihydroflavonol 4-reductase n=1 Tax=Phtheirospermum japonicum TaxID=374723 RepID=A0A830BAJ9_9LAMI|nr:vestitone reductase [Phtheirospermum japonicum]